MWAQEAGGGRILVSDVGSEFADTERFGVSVAEQIVSRDDPVAAACSHT